MVLKTFTDRDWIENLGSVRQHLSISAMRFVHISDDKILVFMNVSVRNTGLLSHYGV